MRLALVSMLMVPLTLGCGSDGKDGSAGADGEDGAPGADGADGEDALCAGVDTLTFVDDGVTWPADGAAGEATTFTAHLNDTGMEVSLAFYGLAAVDYTGGTEFSATITEDSSFIVMATDSCSIAIHTVYFDVADTPVPPGEEVFAYTGGEQYFVVPDGVTEISVEAFAGAGGDNDDGLTGGMGGYVQATIPVTPGETLAVYVGQKGPTKSDDSSRLTGGFNGGGDVVKSSGAAGGGTGGGATDIRSAPYELDDRLVVAGGGGGAGWSDHLGYGGAGGGLTGGDGFSSASSYDPGRGGTQTDGGIGAYFSSSYPNEDGVFGVGGACWHDGAECGAGGGGWYGGGGGAFVGGGGGSSYTIPEASGVVHTQGVNDGDGELYISW